MRLTMTGRYALRLGIPPTVTPGNAILSALSSSINSHIPQSFLLELNLALISHQWVESLGDDETRASGQHPDPQSLLPSFDGQCALLRAQYPSPWPKTAEISFLALQLQVYSFVINKEVSTSEGTAPESATTTHIIHARVLSILLRLINEVSKEDPAKPHWPVFAKYHVMLAASISIYIAASTWERMTRLTLLEACKDAIGVLTGWSMFPKDQTARIINHLNTAIRRVESRGHEVLKFDTRKPAISARMAANIAYQLIWSAKHNRTPHSSEPATTVPQAPTFSSHVQDVAAPAQLPVIQQQPQQFDGIFTGMEESSFFEGMDDADFTDIFLDWQLLRGDMPECA